MDKEKKDIFSLYGSDNIQYAKYDKGEAEKIIIPTEATASAVKKQSDLVLSSDKSDLITGFLDFAEGLGEIYIGIFIECNTIIICFFLAGFCRELFCCFGNTGG